jgi:polyphosphate:AMP phosphotransferase
MSKKLSKEEYEKEVDTLRVELLNAQFDLREANFSLLILLTGIDRLAVEETFDLLHEWLDARYVDSNACLDPTEEELERPFLWRYARMLPLDGRVGIFLDAWVKELVGGRVLGAIGDDTFERRLNDVTVFSRVLADDGNVPLRFFFDLSKKDLEKRVKKAKKDPAKEWRASEVERRFVASYDEARPMIDELLEKTGSSDAPWIKLEESDRRRRNLIVGRAIRDAIIAGIERSQQPAPAPAVELPRSGKSVLASVDLTRTLAKDEYRERLDELQSRLRRLALAARKEGHTSILAFEGWDAAGKGGAIRRLTGAMDARDYKVVPIAAPTEEERRHHYLWRFWRHLPRAGRMLIFDRTWYGRVLVERVEGFASQAEWTRAYAEIREFEEMLAENGTVVCKFWLHIDPEEQLRRFEDREKTPYKKYKITDDDYRNRGKWDEYVDAIDEMVERTTTRAAPWHIVPANDKRVARIQVLETVCDALESS